MILKVQKSLNRNKNFKKNYNRQKKKMRKKKKSQSQIQNESKYKNYKYFTCMSDVGNFFLAVTLHSSFFSSRRPDTTGEDWYLYLM